MIGVLAIDSTVISQAQPSDFNETIVLIDNFAARGIKIAIVATKEKDLSSARTRLSGNTSNIDLYISGEKSMPGQVGKFKGGPQRIESIANTLGVPSHKILYLGDDRYDYTSAVNSGAFFILANWINKDRGGKFTSQSANNPAGVWIFASHFLMHNPRWSFYLDLPKEKMKFRALMGSNTSTGGNVTVLNCDPPQKSFVIRDVIKDHKQYKAGGRQASEILLWHTIASAKLEGLFDSKTVATIYPSSQMGQTNPTLSKFISIGAMAFGSRFYADLLLRAVSVPSSRSLRVKGVVPSFDLQTNSVHINPAYLSNGKSKLKGKKVIVFDDFHTDGNSLDWARNLLIAAGAEEVILISIGKFGGASLYHRVYTPNSFVAIDPFVHKQYGPRDFHLTSAKISTNLSHTAVISQSFNQFVAKQPY